MSFSINAKLLIQFLEEAVPTGLTSAAGEKIQKMPLPAYGCVLEIKKDALIVKGVDKNTSVSWLRTLKAEEGLLNIHEEGIVPMTNIDSIDIAIKSFKDVDILKVSFFEEQNAIYMLKKTPPVKDFHVLADFNARAQESWKHAKGLTGTVKYTKKGDFWSIHKSGFDAPADHDLKSKIVMRDLSTFRKDIALMVKVKPQSGLKIVTDEESLTLEFGDYTASYENYQLKSTTKMVKGDNLDLRGIGQAYYGSGFDAIANVAHFTSLNIYYGDDSPAIVIPESKIGTTGFYMIAATSEVDVEVGEISESDLALIDEELDGIDDDDMEIDMDDI
jgi:hypothetical protein